VNVRINEIQDKTPKRPKLNDKKYKSSQIIHPSLCAIARHTCD
jgi:hypothetical protein